jgi:hypothetical protein
MFTDRSAVSGGRNQAYGADAAFGFYQNVQVSGYAARTETPGRTRDATSLQARVDYAADRYGANVEYLKVGPDFNPEIGFLRRRDFRKSSATLRFSPRPASMPSIRKFTWQVRADYFENNAGVVESREQNGRFVVELQSSDVLQVDFSNFFERLVTPLPVAGLVVTPGAYEFWDTRVQYMIGQQRRVSGTVALRRGRLYGGDITGVEFSSARVVVSPRLSVEPSLLVNRLTLPAGRATQTLARARADYGFSSRMFASALLQFNSTDHTFSSNFRYRWEYRPGSEFFVVWTDEHGTDAIGPSLRNRAFVVKITRLLRL